MDNQEIIEIYKNNILVKNCETIKNNAIRIQTIFKYLNGENMDLFLEKIQNENSYLYRLSDYGNSLIYYEELGKKENKIIYNLTTGMCLFSEVKTEDGEFYVLKENELPNIFDILSLIQICFSASSIKSFYN